VASGELLNDAEDRVRRCRREDDKPVEDKVTPGEDAPEVRLALGEGLPRAC
jgi:hypothetical protein